MRIKAQDEREKQRDEMWRAAHTYQSQTCQTLTTELVENMSVCLAYYNN